MTETIMLPQSSNGLVQTSHERGTEETHRWFQFDAIKNSQIETARLVTDLKNHVTVENGITRTMLLEANHRHETLVRDIEARSRESALRDAKEEVALLKIKTASAVVAV